jgi:AcrR family transcriptional regulator
MPGFLKSGPTTQAASSPKGSSKQITLDKEDFLGMGADSKASFDLHASGYLHIFLGQAMLIPVETPKTQKTLTHDRIIEAAREEFGERGIEAATTRGIAKRAGCNEVTLFRHFESKQKLLASVVRSTSANFESLCSCDDGFSGDLMEDLMRFAEVYTDSFERCEGMARVLIAAGKRRPNLTRELIGDVIDPFHDSMERYLKEAQRDNKVRADLQCRVFAEIFTASLMAGVLRRNSNLSNFDRKTWIEETVKTFVKGIGSGAS